MCMKFSGAYTYKWNCRRACESSRPNIQNLFWAISLLRAMSSDYRDTEDVARTTGQQPFFSLLCGHEGPRTSPDFRQCVQLRTLVPDPERAESLITSFLPTQTSTSQWHQPCSWLWVSFFIFSLRMFTLLCGSVMFSCYIFLCFLYDLYVFEAKGASQRVNSLSSLQKLILKYSLD